MCTPLQNPGYGPVVYYYFCDSFSHFNTWLLSKITRLSSCVSSNLNNYNKIPYDTKKVRLTLSISLCLLFFNRLLPGLDKVEFEFNCYN